MDQREMSRRGGKARAAKLSAERRREIARLGGLARVRKHGHIRKGKPAE